MTRFFLGESSLRILKNDGDDPEATPSTSYDKFRFDSHVEDLGYIDTILEIDGALGAGYYPAGSTADNALYYIYVDGSTKYIYVFPGHIVEGAGVEKPYYTEVQRIEKSTGMTQHVVQSTNYNSGYNTGKVDAITTICEVINPSGGGAFPSGNHYLARVNDPIDGSSPSNYTYRVAVWRLVMDGTYSTPSATPVAGQENVRVNSSEVKIARPGFDIGSATGQQLIADSNNIPAKIIAAGTFSIGDEGGTYDITIPFPVSANVFVDVYMTDAEVSQYFSIPCLGYRGGISENNGQTKVCYGQWINSTTYRITNNAWYAMRGRYMIYAAGDGQTSGSGDVMRRGNDGTQDFVQLCRPGAAANPNLDDIIVDSRFSYIPLIGHGYVPRSSFAGSGYTVRTDDLGTQYVVGKQSYTLSGIAVPDGMVIFPKVLWHSSGASVYTTNGNQYQIVWQANIQPIPTGYESQITLIDDANKTVEFWQSDGGYQYPVPGGTQQQPYDLYYFLFAIPETL